MEQLKRITELQDQINDLKKIDESLKIQMDAIKQSKDEALVRHYKQMFAGALMEGDEVQKGYDGFYIKRKDDGYNKEIIGVTFGSERWDDKEVNKIETNFYSTSENGDFELKRMITLGRVAMIILDFKDDIIAGYNQIKEDFRPHLLMEHTKLGASSTAIQECERGIDAIRRNEIQSLLDGEGVMFSMSEQSHRNPRLEIRYNHDIRDIVNLKILSKTASGLSAKIEVTRLQTVWHPDADKSVVEEVVDTFDKVRVTNIESFVFNNTELIKNTILD